jgi:glucuronoarabinoxylan endo-1,4-beta-xylanase
MSYEKVQMKEAFKDGVGRHTEPGPARTDLGKISPSLGQTRPLYEILLSDVDQHRNGLMRISNMAMIRSIARSGSALVFLTAPFFGHAQTASINGGTTYQTIDGFGASTGYVERNNNMTSAQAASYFSATSGIGLTWIRIQDCGSSGDCPQQGNSSYAPDLQTLQYAVNNGAKVFISFDFPSTNGPSWSTHTTYDLGKIAYLQSQGVPVSEVSPINEPSNGNNYTNADVASEIEALGPALSGAGYSIPIAMPEWLSAWTTSTDFYSDCIAAPSTCLNYVNVAAGHGYGTWPFDYGSGHFPQAPAGFNVYSSRHAWQTEVNDGISKTYTCNNNQLAPLDTSIADGVAWAENIYDFLVNQNGSLWMYWNLQSGYTDANDPNGCNDGLADYYFNPAKRFYTLGNYSKFVRPGWTMISATGGASGTYITAFENQSTGQFAIVAINSNSSSVSQPFNLSSLSGASVTPYITDASNNLAAQSPISISGNSFTATLNATSVTTFVSGGGAPGAPSNLTGSIVQ